MKLDDDKIERSDNFPEYTKGLFKRSNVELPQSETTVVLGTENNLKFGFSISKDWELVDRGTSPVLSIWKNNSNKDFNLVLAGSIIRGLKQHTAEEKLNSLVFVLSESNNHYVDNFKSSILSLQSGQKRFNIGTSYNLEEKGSMILGIWNYLLVGNMAFGFSMSILAHKDKADNCDYSRPLFETEKIAASLFFDFISVPRFN